jgi:hypothetical protein
VNETYCEIVEKVRNLVPVIGERKQDSKIYEYNAYHLKEDHSLEAVANDYSNEWGLSANGNLSGSFWVNENNFIYVGSAFDRVINTLYLIVNKINNKTNSSSYHLMTRKLKANGFWAQWKGKEITKFNEIFNAFGIIFGIDGNDTIHSLDPIDEEMNFKPIVSETKQKFCLCLKFK